MARIAAGCYVGAFAVGWGSKAKRRVLFARRDTVQHIKFVKVFLDWLLETAISRRLPGRQSYLSGVEKAIDQLQRIVINQSAELSNNIHRAVALLRLERRQSNRAVKRGDVTYSGRSWVAVSQTAANVEQTAKLFCAWLITPKYSKYLGAKPDYWLRQRLTEKGYRVGGRREKAIKKRVIEARVRRFKGQLHDGHQFSPRQILQQQYMHFLFDLIVRKYGHMGIKRLRAELRRQWRITKSEARWLDYLCRP